MNAGEIRLYLKQAALLSNPVEPQLSTPQLNAWIDGTLDDPNPIPVRRLLTGGLEVRDLEAAVGF